MPKALATTANNSFFEFIYFSSLFLVFRRVLVLLLTVKKRSPAPSQPSFSGLYFPRYQPTLSARLSKPDTGSCQTLMCFKDDCTLINTDLQATLWRLPVRRL
jgi:hypothetical protein